RRLAHGHRVRAPEAVGEALEALAHAARAAPGRGLEDHPDQRQLRELVLHLRRDPPAAQIERDLVGLYGEPPPRRAGRGGRQPRRSAPATRRLTAAVSTPPRSGLTVVRIAMPPG